MTPEQIQCDIDKAQDEGAKKLIHAWFLTCALNGGTFDEYSLKGSTQVVPPNIGRCNLDYTITFTVNHAEVLEDEGL